MCILYFYTDIFISETLVKAGPDEDDMLEEDFFSSAFGGTPFLRNALLGSVWGQLIFFPHLEAGNNYYNLGKEPGELARRKSDT